MKKVILKLLLILAVLITTISCKTQNPISKNVSYPTPSTYQVPLRLVVMSDSRGSEGGVSSQVVIKIMEGIKNISPQPTFAVMPGDLVSGSGSYSELKDQLMHFKDIVTKLQ